MGNFIFQLDPWNFGNYKTTPGFFLPHSAAARNMGTPLLVAAVDSSPQDRRAASEHRPAAPRVAPEIPAATEPPLHGTLDARQAAHVAPLQRPPTGAPPPPQDYALDLDEAYLSFCSLIPSSLEYKRQSHVSLTHTQPTHGGNHCRRAPAHRRACPFGLPFSLLVAQ